MARWSLDLQSYSNTQLEKIHKIRRSFLFALYNSITFKTPVDTGRARGNWNVSQDIEDVSTSENKRPKYTTVRQMPDPEDDNPLFISNGLDYIERLEYGYSKQAPEGMVGVTVANADNTLQGVIRSTR